MASFFVRLQSMEKDKKNIQDEYVPKSTKGRKLGIFKSIVPIIVALITVIPAFMEQIGENAQDKYEQNFSSTNHVVNKFGIECVEYKITSKPAVPGFHLIVYPYVVYEMNGCETYIPIMGQFSQCEYVADDKGVCLLFRENTSEELEKIVTTMTDYSVEVKCFIVARYVVNGQEKREVYDLMDGQLKKSERKVVAEVLKLREDEDSMKIDMLEWPYFNKQTIQKIFA